MCKAMFKRIAIFPSFQVYVKDVTLNGLVVKISKGIYSFIPCMHLADVPIKHPEKKFEAGQKLKSRVKLTLCCFFVVFFFNSKQ